MLFWLFLTLFKEQVNSWQKELLNGKAQIKFRRKGDKQKCRRVDTQVFYQGVTEVKIMKRRAKSENYDDQRAEVGLQEHCTQTRIRNKSSMMFLQTAREKI